MVRYVREYDLAIRNLESTDFYKEASNNEKISMRALAKVIWGEKLVPQLTLYESLVIGFLSKSQHPSVKKFVTSGSFRKSCDNLEERIYNLGNNFFK